MEPMMAVAREFLIEDMQDRFDREVDLNGVPWPPRNPQYLKQLNKTGYKGRKILQKDYHLIEAVTDRDSYKVTAKTLSINTRGWPVYWHAHNVGSTVGRGKKLPKREFLGMSEAIAFDLIEAFDDYVEGWLKVIWPKRSTGIPMERGALGRISKRIHASDPSRAASVRDQLRRGV
jgi:phage gpG-like protein